MSTYSHHRAVTFLGVLGLLTAAPLHAMLNGAVPQELVPRNLNDRAEEETPDDPNAIMTASLDRIAEVISALDPEAERTENNWQFSLEGRSMLVVTDTSAGRMRIMTPIAQSSGLPEGAMERLLQANFDTALDARYAIANGLVWGTYLHPLDSLTTRDFASGVLQTQSVAQTFGTTFSSGVVNYGGGDSGAIIENQLEELLEEFKKRKIV
ncbi:MAG: hypothetical protein AAF553_12405 [Pseudomonadota bacterium]